MGGPMEEVPIHTGFVGFWKRVLAYIIQVSILCIPVVYAYRYLIVLSSKTGSLMPFVIYWIFYYAFSVFLMVRYGGTVGKLVLGLRIVDNTGQYLSISRSIIRLFPYILYSTVYTLSLNEVITSQVNSNGGNLSHNKGVYDAFDAIVGLIFFIDVIVILFNRKKRAIHDFLAGSYVVKKNFIPLDYIDNFKVEKIHIIKNSKIPKYSMVSTIISSIGFAITIYMIVIARNTITTNAFVVNLGAASVLSSLFFAGVGILLSIISLFKKTENKNTMFVHLVINTVFILAIILYSILR
jgi:uncharacterized RDD family membrane protein YckC